MAEISDIIQTIPADLVINEELEISVRNKDDIEVSVGAHTEAEIELVDNNAFDIQLQSPPLTNAVFGIVYQVDGASVLYATTDTWNSTPELIAKRGWIYIYSDWRHDVVGREISGIKVGNGVQRLIDLPFTDEQLFQHIEDSLIHVTAEEKEFWNNKVRCYMSETNASTLIFTTN